MHQENRTRLGGHMPGGRLVTQKRDFDLLSNSFLTSEGQSVFKEQELQSPRNLCAGKGPLWPIIHEKELGLPLMKVHLRLMSNSSGQHHSTAKANVTV